MRCLQPPDTFAGFATGCLWLKKLQAQAASPASNKMKNYCVRAVHGDSMPCFTPIVTSGLPDVAPQIFCCSLITLGTETHDRPWIAHWTQVACRDDML